MAYVGTSGTPVRPGTPVPVHHETPVCARTIVRPGTPVSTGSSGRVRTGLPLPVSPRPIQNWAYSPVPTDPPLRPRTPVRPKTPIRAGTPPIRAGTPPIRTGTPPIRTGTPPIRTRHSLTVLTEGSLPPRSGTPLSSQPRTPRTPGRSGIPLIARSKTPVNFRTNIRTGRRVRTMVTPFRIGESTFGHPEKPLRTMEPALTSSPITIAPPIRVGIIGLSSSSSGTSWAGLAHLPYLASSSQYEVTGVLNSSYESSKAAITAFKLSKTATPFPDIKSMASDPNIDMIVVCVEVKQHAPLVRAAIEGGKNVYCEWPLARNAREASELATLASFKGVQTYVGLESRVSPPWMKLREMISGGAIGKLRSSTVWATLGHPIRTWSTRALPYLYVESGQSPLHTRFAQFLEGFCSTLGDFEAYQSEMTTHQKRVRVYDVPLPKLADAVKDKNTPFRSVHRTSPDDIVVHGRLSSGAIAAIHFSSEGIDMDGNILRWIITGSMGRIEITQKYGQFLRDMSVEIKLVQGYHVKNIELDWETDGDFKMYGEKVVLTAPGRNYKAIAEKDFAAVVDFNQAARRHAMLDRMVYGQFGEY